MGSFRETMFVPFRSMTTPVTTPVTRLARLWELDGRWPIDEAVRGVGLRCSRRRFDGVVRGVAVGRSADSGRMNIRDRRSPSLGLLIQM